MKFISDFANQLWTLLGMFIAWVVMEGSARIVVGYAILITTLMYAITYKVRNLDDSDE